MNKVLVTGAGGFIGSHLVEFLIRKGYDVKAFIHYNSLNSHGCLEFCDEKVKNEIDIFTGDIRDPYGVKRAMYDCETVFHLAALIGIPYSYHSPETYIETNVKGTLNILQAARELGVERIVHTSTSEVYGTARFVPITEEHPLQAQSPYSASKIAADHLAMSFNYSFKTPVSIVRPFNTYGPRQSARAVIPTIISQIASGKRIISLGALHPTRDFNYIEDTVNGFFSVAECSGSVGEIINIGSNFEISIGGLVKLIANIMSKQIEIESETERLRPEKSEVNRLWADNSKAKDLIKWQPSYGKIEGLQRGLSKTIHWFTQPENLERYRYQIYNI